MSSTDTALTRFLPALVWARDYRRAWLTHDLMAGLAAGSVVVPQAMAYATIAGLPIEVGLYTCIVPMLAYVVLGGSRTMSVSTTSTLALLSGATLLTADVAASSDDPARALATLTVLVGVLLLIGRLFRLGALVDNISEATLTGIKAGVGLTVAAGQLPKLVGVAGDPDASAFFGEVSGVLSDFDAVSWATIALSGATIAAMLVLAKLAPGLPAPLIAVAAGIALVAVWSVDTHGIAVVGEVPAGLPGLVRPDLGLVDDLTAGAFAVAVMCFFESASVAGAVRRPEEPTIDNDRELVASGVGNVLGGLFRAMPSAGGFSQTAMNVRVGARTQVSALVTASLAIACALFLGGVLADLPEATLGSLVVVAVVGLITPSQFVRYWRVDRLSFWIATGTAVAGLVVGLIAAVLIGVILTLLLLLHELNRVGVTELQATADGADLVPTDATTHRVTGLLILRVDGPLYTANVRRVRRAIIDYLDERRSEPTEVVVVDLTAISKTTITVADQLVQLRQGVADRHAELWLVAVAPPVAEVATGLPDWEEMLASGLVHPTARSAMLRYRERHRLDD